VAAITEERVTQVPATTGVHAPAISQHELPSPLSVGVLALIGVAIYTMFVFPGPTWATISWAEGIFGLLRIDNGGRVGATVLLLAPLLPLLLLLFVVLQGRTLSTFA